MKVILYMAISLNGLIADENGNEDFLSHKNWEEFIKLAKRIDNFIYGRKTYESVITWGEPFVSDIKSIKNKIVVSEHSDLTPTHGFTLARSPQEALDILQKENCSEVLLSGGSTNNSAFAREGRIDEVIFDVEPFILGKGIPVFKTDDFNLKLSLLEATKPDNELLQLRYKVEK